jgi:hypothetical protein
MSRYNGFASDEDTVVRDWSMVETDHGDDPQVIAVNSIDRLFSVKNMVYKAALDVAKIRAIGASWHMDVSGIAEQIASRSVLELKSHLERISRNFGS